MCVCGVVCVGGQGLCVGKGQAFMCVSEVKVYDSTSSLPPLHLYSPSPLTYSSPPVTTWRRP